MNAHTFRSLSPAQAAQAADTSRWSIMRAIKAGKLRATRGNRNQWLIAPEDLAAWQAAHPAQCADTIDAAQVAPLAAHPDTALRAEVEELRVDLATATVRAEAAEARAAIAEADRDAWRAQAERLATRPASPARRSWWPWGRS